MQGNVPAAKSPDYTSSFDPVLEHELKQVEARRVEVLKDKGDANQAHRPPDDQPGAVQRKAQRLDLVGLALSGGGIRSATFNLGILQSLASLDLLKRVDYISSVSGGGYIHAWLAAWVRREATWGDVIARKDVSPVENVSRQMAPSRVTQAQAYREGLAVRTIREDESAPVHHLREYSRYLAPRSGLLSLDSWALVGLYLRNLLANGLLFVAAGVVLSLACRLLVLAFTAGRPSELVAHLALAIVLDLLIFAQVRYRQYLAAIRAHIRGASPTDPHTTRSADAEWRKILYAVVLPCVLASAVGLWMVGPSPGGSRLPSWLRFYTLLGGSGSWWNQLGDYPVYALILGLIGALMAGYGLRFESRRVRTAVPLPPDVWFRRGVVVLGGAAFGSTFGLALSAVVNHFGYVDPSVSVSAARPGLLVAFGPPALMVALTVSGYLEAIINGRFLSEQEREWRARVGAMTLTAGLVWAVVFAVVLYLPWVAQWLGREFGPKLKWATIGGWVASGAASYLLRPASGPKPTGATGNRLIRWVLMVAPMLFLAGAITLTSLLAHVLPGVAHDTGDYIQQVEQGSSAWVVFWLAFIGLSGCVYAYLIQPNLFSLHSVYGNRLVRCYLAASRQKAGWHTPPEARSPADPSPGVPTGVRDIERQGDVFTGFGHRDDFSLLWLQPDADAFPPALDGIDEPWRAERTPYLGPYPLFNTTLNLVGGADLATQDRKGEAFILSPGYSGSNVTGWARFSVPEADPLVLAYPTAHGVVVAGPPQPGWERAAEADPLVLAYPIRRGVVVDGPPQPASGRPVNDVSKAYLARNLTVGRAMTISGAAVDPNMQAYQSGGLTALLTLLNLRLGWWIQNPWTARPRPDRPAVPWTAETPWSAWYLVCEAIGRTRADTEYVHLSDGGHFENTGAYELIRRRCRFVVLIDAAEDELDASENLANLMRLVRTDFGVRIEMDTSPLRKNAAGHSPAHVAVGLIRYDDADHGAVNGTLMFIRSSLTGDEPADLLNYAATNPPFPHHGTIDQFFDESQFESYRCLGHHIGMGVFGPAAAELTDRPSHDRRYNRDLFAELRQRWTGLPAGILDANYTSVETWLELEQALRTDPRTARLTLDMYPEVAGAIPAIDRFGAPVERWLTEVGKNRIAELRVMAALVQMMESAWMKMNLDNTFAQATQRGWMNCFRRYTAADSFQEYWPVLRPMYAAGFARFCERVLNLAPVPVEAVRWDRIDDAEQAEIRSTLTREFAREWATALDGSPGWERDYLDRALTTTARFGGAAGVRPLVWVFRYGQPGRPADRDPLSWDWPGRTGGLPPYPVGVAAVRPWVADDGGAGDGLEYYELLLWVRGGHRTTDIAQSCLPNVLACIDTDFGPAGMPSGNHRCLFTRFPKTGGTAADSYQRAIWTTFFNDNDFAAYQLSAGIARKEIRLRRYLPKQSVSARLSNVRR